MIQSVRLIAALRSDLIQKTFFGAIFFSPVGSFVGLFVVAVCLAWSPARRFIRVEWSPHRCCAYMRYLWPTSIPICIQFYIHSSACRTRSAQQFAQRWWSTRLYGTRTRYPYRASRVSLSALPCLCFKSRHFWPAHPLPIVRSPHTVQSKSTQREVFDTTNEWTYVRWTLRSQKQLISVRLNIVQLGFEHVAVDGDAFCDILTFKCECGDVSVHLPGYACMCWVPPVGGSTPLPPTSASILKQ